MRARSEARRAENQIGRITRRIGFLHGVGERRREVEARKWK
ncbi:hypothetical protein HMPREF1545_00204 [Oscillibacter sp. KLE 1728]|nr:hypothetical protein HMPREF1545_00204 [Oscillibacter sp. KLE 1728]